MDRSRSSVKLSVFYVKYSLFNCSPVGERVCLIALLSGGGLCNCPPVGEGASNVPESCTEDPPVGEGVSDVAELVERALLSRRPNLGDSVCIK